MTEAAPRSDAAARLVDVVRTYRIGDAEVRALDGVTVEFRRHRCTTVVGPSGSGKTTLLHCLAGLEPVTSGEVYVGAVALGGSSRRTRALVRREHIGIVFQGFNLHPGLDVAHNIALPATIAGRKDDAEWVDALVHRLRLRQLLDRRPAELSGGEQQRVAAARALAGKPQVLLADEPTGNLDRDTGRELLDVLRAATDELGQTVVIVTHDLRAACIGDRVVVLEDGRVSDVVDAPTIDVLTNLLGETTDQQGSSGGIPVAGGGTP